MIMLNKHSFVCSCNYFDINIILEILFVAKLKSFSLLSLKAFSLQLLLKAVVILSYFYFKIFPLS